MNSAFSKDFIELQLRYQNATLEERNLLWPDFIRAIREAAPGFIEEFDRAFRSCDYLMAMFEQCMKRTFDRPELDAGRKTTALEDTAAFFALLDEFKRDDLRVEEMRELAHQLATITLFAGVRSSEFISDRQRRLANITKKERPWMEYTRMLARAYSQIVGDVRFAPTPTASVQPQQIRDGRKRS
jgi:hypothetical protein